MRKAANKRAARKRKNKTKRFFFQSLEILPNNQRNHVMPTATPEKEVTRLRDLKNGARDMFTLDPRIILISEGENPRDYTLAENRAHLDKLKASIRVHGVQQPLWVRYDIAGKCAILILSLIHI
jgi:hypothetical protein